ncbi:MAG: hypothetical protein CR988_05635 [Treponema sp.]|nr:MAG: hypothetical protein CR988_05635 [Treponema sp.]
MSVFRFKKAVMVGIVGLFLLVAVFSIDTSTADAQGKNEWLPVFPSALFVENLKPNNLNKQIYYVKNITEIEAEKKMAESRLQSVLLNNDLFGIYGKPNAYTMGMLGQYNVEDLDPIMDKYVKIYDEANGNRGIIPALYIIYGTCFPGGDIGLLSDATTLKYIKYATERGWYVFLDHQIGKYSVEHAMNAILPFLKYPNVHLAIDPEWHTTKPREVIGSVTAEEINKAQQMMQDYIVKHNIYGRRFFVIHQFHSAMIKSRHKVKSNFERVQLIHCSDGHGSPRVKRDTYAFNGIAKNMPLKSFKLFTKTTVEGPGYDIPLMTPKEVFELKPRPYFIMYQ